jgi:hypothetical protein
MVTVEPVEKVMAPIRTQLALVVVMLPELGVVVEAGLALFWESKLEVVATPLYSKMSKPFCVVSLAPVEVRDTVMVPEAVFSL